MAEMNGVLVFLVVLSGVGVAGLARRWNLQAPLVLVTVGSLVSFVPGLPRLDVPPEIILTGVLPPLLFSAALRFPLATLRRHLPAIVGLGVVLVVVTAGAVGLVADLLVPSAGLAVALVLGAVVAPTDAVSAVSIARRLAVPRRVIDVLTGESLINDAAALTILWLALAAAGARARPLDPPVLFFAYEVVGGVAIGLALAVVARWVRRGLAHSPLETVVGLLLPLAAYLAAERVGVSGVLAVVAAGMYVGHHATEVSVATRLQERSVWESVDLAFETFVFAYMGLQLRFVIEEVRAHGLSLAAVLGRALVVLAVVIAVRPVVVLAIEGLRRIRSGPRSPTRWRESVVVSWAGMRGVVTLAAAGGIPLTLIDGSRFPARESIQVTAFVVAVGTLVLQAATMPRLIRALDVADAHEEQYVDQQFSRARRIAREAGVAALGGHAEREDLDPAVRRRVRDLLDRIAADAEERRADGVLDRDQRVALARVRRDVLARQRAALIAAREDGRLDDEVLRGALADLDVEEAAAELRVDTGRRFDTPPV